MESLQPHLLLCDINLQAVHSGIELITRLRQAYRFEVIYITSYQSRSIIEQTLATQPANYLIKPLDEAQLFAGVQLVLSKMSRKLELKDENNALPLWTAVKPPVKKPCHQAAGLHSKTDR